MIRIPKLKYNTPVEVIWWDANSTSGWRDEDVVRKEKSTICHSVGYYVTHDNDALILSPDYTDDKERSTTLIPRGMIKEIRKL